MQPRACLYICVFVYIYIYICIFVMMYIYMRLSYTVFVQVSRSAQARLRTTSNTFWLRCRNPLSRTINIWLNWRNSWTTRASAKTSWIVLWLEQMCRFPESSRNHDRSENLKCCFEVVQQIGKHTKKTTYFSKFMFSHEFPLTDVKLPFLEKSRYTFNNCINIYTYREIPPLYPQKFFGSKPKKLIWFHFKNYKHIKLAKTSH